MNKLWKNGPLLIVIAAILWALDTLIRVSLFVLPPIVIVFYEHLIGSIILLPFLLKDFKNIKINAREIKLIIFVSLLSGLLGTLWFTTALLKVNFIPLSVVLLLQKLQPLFAMTTAAIFLKEKIHKDYAIWAILAIGSAYFVTFPNGQVNLATGAGTIIAALYALGAAAAWGSSTTFSRMALMPNKSEVMTGLRFIITTLFALIGVILFGEVNKLGIDLSQLGRFIFIALSTGMVALVIYYRGLKLTQAKIATLLELVYPMLGVFIDIFINKTILAPTQYFAAVVLLFAMFRISQLNKEEYI